MQNEDGLGPLKPQMTERQQAFFHDQSFVILGALDPAGDPWAGVAVGAAGFIASPDPKTLVAQTRLSRADVLAESIVAGAKIAMLGIDFAAKRRNRANGMITATDAAGFTIGVEQAFGNCPKYIQDHDLSVLIRPHRFEARRLSALDERARRLICESDVCFVASTTRTHAPDSSSGMDVSHRGGPKGFVRLAPDGRLTIPDFVGNGYYNTLGNMLDAGRAGLLFLDFSTGDRLQITGTVHIHWEDSRHWSLTPTAARWMTAKKGVRLKELDCFTIS